MEELEGAELWRVMMELRGVAGGADDECRRATLGLALEGREWKGPLEPVLSLQASELGPEVLSRSPVLELLRPFYFLAPL